MYLPTALLCNYGFGLDVFVHCLVAPFASVAALFEAAEGSFQIKVAALDITLPGPNSPGDFQRTCLILGINSGRQTIYLIFKISEKKLSES